MKNTRNPPGVFSCVHTWIIGQWYNSAYLHDLNLKTTMDQNEHASHGAVASKTKSLRGAGLLIVSILAVIIPAFALPIIGTPFYFTKFFLVFVGVVALLALFFFIALREHSFSVDVSVLRAGVVLLPIGYLVVSLFSSQPLLSFVGERVEADTFFFALIASLVAILTSVFIRNASDGLRIFTVFLFAGIFVALFQVIHVIFGGAFEFLGFTGATDNLIGKWKDLGILVGLLGSLSLVTLELVPLKFRQMVLLVGTVVLSLVVLAVVNSTVAWFLFGLVALATFISVVTRHVMLFSPSPEKKPKTGVLAGIVVVIAAVFVFFGTSISNPFANLLSVQSLEVRPSFQGTFDVARGVYEENALFGSGPNTFSYQWLLHRSPDIAQTPFWNVTFLQGAGFIPTTFTTGGILLSIFWLFFIGAIVYTILRALLFTKQQGGREVFFVTLLASLSVLYLLVAHFFYATGQALVMLMFVFVGVLLAMLRGTRMVKTVSFTFAQSQRIALTFVTAGVIILIVAAGAVYGIGRMYVAAYYHEQGLQAGNRGELDRAYEHVETATRLYPIDRHFRTLALIDVANMNALANTAEEDREALQSDFELALTRSLENTNQAIARNPARFENWMTRGTVLSFVLPSNIDGAYENTIALYEEARLRSPTSPEVDLRIAETHLTQGAVEPAKVALDEALRKKPDYTNAVLLRANIAIQENNLDEAIVSLENAAFLNPDNAQLFYQIGILHLQNENYESGALAFETALGIVPDFANAAFFLAQAYTFLGETDAARQLLEQLRERNPDQVQLTELINALNEGSNPFIPEDVLPPEEVEEETIQ